MENIFIGENEAGQRLDKFLHKYFKEAPHSFLCKMLRKKNITLNGKKAKGSEKLATGDTLTFFMAAETVDKFRGVLNGQGRQYADAFSRIGPLAILFENKHILLVDKPAGLLAQKARQTDVSLNEWLIGYLLFTGSLDMADLATFKPSVCNRLDRNTSGIVLCGKTLSGMQAANALLRERTLHKFYRLYVKGIIKEGGTLKGHLVKDGAANRVSVFAHALGSGKECEVLTKYTPLAWCQDMTLLEAQLITGKPHQIRAQFAAAGHPLIGDDKYGDKDYNRHFKQQYCLQGQMLHAYRLEFPAMGEEFADMDGLSVTAPLPAAFLDIWESRQWQRGIQEG